MFIGTPSGSDPGDGRGLFEIPAPVQPVYQASEEHFEEVFTITAVMEETMTMLDTAAATVAAERDFHTEVGLQNLDPEGRMTAARATFEADDPELAAKQAGLAVGMIGYAPQLGRERLARGRRAWTSVATAGSALLLMLTARAVNWRRGVRRRSASAEDSNGDALVEAGPEVDDAASSSGGRITRV